MAKFCPACGSACKPDAGFCPACGNKLAAAPARSKGKKLPAKARQARFHRQGAGNDRTKLYLTAVLVKISCSKVYGWC